MVDHDRVQAALSARLDGEPAPLPDDVVDAHVAECEQCAAFWEQSLALSRTLSFAEPADGGMTPPDLSEVIIAGVEPEWRRTANARAVGLALARILIIISGIAWVVWSLQLLGDAGGLTAVTSGGQADGQILAPDADPRSAGLLVDAAAHRLGIAFGLFAVAWKPRLVSGMLPVVGALWMFLFGFTVRDMVLGTVESGQYLGLLLLLVTLAAMAWAWLSHHGYVILRAGWRELGATPV